MNPRRTDALSMEALLAIRKRVFDELLQTRALRQVMAGTMDRAGYIRYLLNVFHYAQYSPVVMAIAASHCLLTHPELASYLLRHAQEETGHDVWAAEDLRDLGVGEEELHASRPVSSCAALIGYTHYVAGFANPIGIFGWMYVLEAVGLDLGNLVAEKLRSAGVKGVRFIAGHAVADTDHTREITEQLESHLQRDEDRAAVLEVANVVADLYLGMFREIGEERAQWA